MTGLLFLKLFFVFVFVWCVFLEWHLYTWTLFNSVVKLSRSVAYIIDSFVPRQTGYPSWHSFCPARVKKTFTKLFFFFFFFFFPLFFALASSPPTPPADGFPPTPPPPLLFFFFFFFFFLPLMLRAGLFPSNSHGYEHTAFWMCARACSHAHTICSPATIKQKQLAWPSSSHRLNRSFN